MPSNEDGPTFIAGKGWRWESSVYGERMIAAERAFWTCDQITFEDVLRFDAEWERMPGDIWARRFSFAKSNKYGDMFSGEFRIQFKPDSAEVESITV